MRMPRGRARAAYAEMRAGGKGAPGGSRPAASASQGPGSTDAPRGVRPTTTNTPGAPTADIAHLPGPAGPSRTTPVPTRRSTRRGGNAEGTGERRGLATTVTLDHSRNVHSRPRLKAHRQSPGSFLTQRSDTDADVPITPPPTEGCAYVLTASVSVRPPPLRGHRRVGSSFPLFAPRGPPPLLCGASSTWKWRDSCKDLRRRGSRRRKG